MLYWLLFQVLHNYVPAFRVFGYITTRVALANLTALALGLVLGPYMIRKLRQMSFGQHIREEGPQSHLKKAGTPTMGGLLIVISIVVPTLLWADLRNQYVWFALLGLVGFGTIGFFDDYAKISKKRNLGLTARQKFWAQVLCGMVVGFLLLLLHANQAYSTAINIPFFKQFKPNLLIEPLTKNFWTYPLAFVPFYIFIVFIMVGSSNAVNLTDGLDGLAIGLMVIASGAMTVLCLPVQQRKIRRLSRFGSSAPLAGTDHLLRLHGGGKPRLSLVQLPSRPGLHGRRGFARARRRTGHCGRLDQTGSSADLHRRRLCD